MAGASETDATFLFRVTDNASQIFGGGGRLLTVFVISTLSGSTDTAPVQGPFLLHIETAI